ncbi:hypothetical protein ACTFIZ_005176 [Dictyostelium cf. discoideum]
MITKQTTLSKSAARCSVLPLVSLRKIHGGSDSFQLIKELLGQHSVKLVFLPTYSPECNPIERLFGYIKNHFHNHRNYEKQFLDEVIETINHVMQHEKNLLLVFIANFCDDSQRDEYKRSR